MFSFSTIAVFATLAFSAVTSAIPFNERDAAGELSAVNAALPVVDTAALVPRADDAKLSLASILTDAQTQLVPFTQQLSTSPPTAAVMSDTDDSRRVCYQAERDR